MELTHRILKKYLMRVMDKQYFKVYKMDKYFKVLYSASQNSLHSLPILMRKQKLVASEKWKRFPGIILDAVSSINLYNIFESCKRLAGKS